MSYLGGRIALALSGGGFRATLFHLGVVRFLHEVGALKSVTLVSAVSGGSILAAHLVAFWERYTASNESFDTIARYVIRFTQRDARGRIVRRWILGRLCLVPLWAPALRKLWAPALRKLPEWLREELLAPYTLPDLLEYQYSTLFPRIRLRHLSRRERPRPQVRLNCTSLTTGHPCYFDNQGFGWSQAGEGKPTHISAMDVKLAYAVAASSAFPPLFPPIDITNRTLSCDKVAFPHAHRLTDGGVYDNLGIENLALGERENFETVILSDAEGNFDSDFDAKYSFIVSRNVRASDLLMNRVSGLRLKHLDTRNVSYARVEIGGRTIDDMDDSGGLTPDLQRALINVRTDLDCFSDFEITALIAHGYSKARQTLIKSKLVTEDAPKFSWDLLQRWDDVQSPGASAKLRLSRVRKRRLWSFRDPASWGTLVWICMVLSIPASLTIQSNPALREMLNAILYRLGLQRSFF